MTKPNSPLSLGLAAVAVLLLTSSPPAVHAGDKEFGQIVHHIESHYRVRRSHRFLLGFVGLVVTVSHPYGVGSLRMALFEDHDFFAGASDDEFGGTVEGALSGEWPAAGGPAATASELISTPPTPA